MESIDGTGLPSQPQTQPQAPKKWSEIEQESLIYSLPPEQRMPIFDQWVKDTQNYQLQAGGFDNPESFQKFKLKELQTRRRLSSEIGADPTPEEVNADYDNYVNIISSEQQRLAAKAPDEKAYKDVIDGNRGAAFVGGQIVFNPKVTKDPTAYRKALAESDAPDDIKLIYAGKRDEEDKKSVVTRRNELASRVITPKVADKVVSAIQEGNEILGFDVGTPQSPAIVKDKAGTWSVVDPDYVNWDESIVGGIATKVLPAANAQYKPMPELNEFQKKYGLTDEEIQTDYLEALKRSAPTSISRWVTNADSLEDYVPVLNSKVRVLDPDVKPKVFVPNADLAFDKEAYDAVVDKAKAPDEAKALAKETRTQIAESIAAPTFDLLLRNRDDFAPYAKDAKDPQAKVAAVSRYYKDKKDQAWYNDIGEFFSQGIGGIGTGLTRLVNLANVVPAMFGDVEAAERAAAVQKAENEKAQAAEMVGSRMGAPTTIKLTRDVAAVLPDLAAQIVISMATGGLGASAAAGSLAARTGVSYTAARGAISAAMANAERGAVRAAVSRIPSIAAGSVDDLADAAIATAKQMSSKNPLKGGLGLQQAVSAATAGMSSMGGTFPEVYSQLRNEGMAPAKALDAARNAAAISGAITGLITYGFSAAGAGGAEDIGTMSQRKAGDFTVRDLVAAGLPDVLRSEYGKQAVIKTARGILGKAGSEGLEEGLDQFIGGISQYLTNPSAEAQDKKVSDIIQESLYAGALGFIVGGGAAVGGQIRQTAGGLTAAQIEAEMAGLTGAPPAPPAPATPPPPVAPAAAPPAAGSTPPAPAAPGAAAVPPSPAPPPAGAATVVSPTGTTTVSTAAPSTVVSAQPPGATRLATRLASQFGVDITTVTPSGANNTVTPNDIRNAARQKQLAEAEQNGVAPPEELPLPPPPPNPLLSEAVGMQIQYEGYEGTLIDDEGRPALQTPDGTVIDIPATFLADEAVNALGITVTGDAAQDRAEVLRMYGETEGEALQIIFGGITTDTDSVVDMAELGVSLLQRKGRKTIRVQNTPEFARMARGITDEQILLAEEQITQAIETTRTQTGIPDDLKQKITAKLEGDLNILSLFIESRDSWQNGLVPRDIGVPSETRQATAASQAPAQQTNPAAVNAASVAAAVSQVPGASITGAALQQAANTAPPVPVEVPPAPAQQPVEAAPAATPAAPTVVEEPAAEAKAVTRDATKPEQMTKDELSAFRKSEAIKTAKDDLSKAKDGTDNPYAFGFKSKAALVRAREDALQKATSEDQDPDVFGTVIEAANQKRPIFAGLIDSLSDVDRTISPGPMGEPGGVVRSARKQLIDSIEEKGYVKEGDLYVFKGESETASVKATEEPAVEAPVEATVETKPTEAPVAPVEAATEPVVEPAAPKEEAPATAPKAEAPVEEPKAAVDIEFVEGDAAEDADIVFMVYSANNYYTLWFKQKSKDKTARPVYVKNLPSNEKDAFSEAKQYASKIASTGKIPQAFVGKIDVYKFNTVGLIDKVVEREKLSTPVSRNLGDSEIRYGEYAGKTINQLLSGEEKEFDYVFSNLIKTNFFSSYIASLPEFEIFKQKQKEKAKQVVTSESKAALKKVGLNVSINEESGEIQISGKTFAWREKLSSVKGKFNYEDKFYSVTPEGYRQLAEEIGGIKVSDGGYERGIPAYVTDERYRRLRREREQDPDRSGLPSAPGQYVSVGTQDLLRKGEESGMPSFVIEEQIEDVALIKRAYTEGKPLFLLSSEPGSGKTYVLGAAIRELIAAGAKKINYITLNENLIEQIKADLAEYGIQDVSFYTYDSIKKKDVGESDVLIFDEGHAIKNIGKGTGRAKKGENLIRRSKFTLVSSATPFENPLEVEYLDAAGVFDDKNEFPEGFDDFVLAFGGYVFSVTDSRGNTVSKLEFARSKGSNEDLMQAREFFRKRGMLTTRRTKLDSSMVDVQQKKVPADKYYVDIFNAINKAKEDKQLTVYARQWFVNFQKRLLEASKIDSAIGEARNAIDEGRYPIIFVETKQAKDFDIDKLVKDEFEYQRTVARAKMMDDSPPPRSAFDLPPEGVVDVFEEAVKSFKIKNISIPSINDKIISAFGKETVAFFTGDFTDLQAKKNLSEWRKGTKKLLVATMAKGGTGLSLHDKSGDHPTTQINVNLPWSATQFTQVAQRSARYGLRSKAKMMWLFTDEIDFDRKLANLVGGRIQSMSALVGGKESKIGETLEEWNIADTTDSERKDVKPTEKPAETADGSPDPNATDDLSVSRSTGLPYTPGEARKAGVTRIASDLGLVNGNQESVFSALEKISKSGNRRHRKVAKDLLKVLQGTDVTVQMISVDPSKNGWFDPATGTVYLNLDGPHETGIVETLLHELVHAGTERAISNPVTPAQKALVDSLQKQMDSARKAAADLIKSKLGKDVDLTNWRGLVNAARMLNDYDFFDVVYGLSSLSEFATHATTSKAFQKFLSGVGKDGKPLGLFDRFVRVIAKYFTGQTDIATDVYNDIISLIGSADKGSVRMPNINREKFGGLVGKPASESRGVTPQMDAEYMSAVEGGDTKTAQRLVDQAAKAAGYNGDLWHGTKSEKIGELSFDESNEGFHIGTKKAAAERLKYINKTLPEMRQSKDNLIKVSIKGNYLTVPDVGYGYLVDWIGAAQDALPVEGQEIDDPFDVTQEQFTEWLMKNGYSGLRYVNEIENAGSTSYAVFDFGSVKSTEPIIKDDAGNVIPLSQRFNPQSPDIRFSESRGIIDQQLALYAPDLKVFVEPGVKDPIAYNGIGLVINEEAVSEMDEDDVRLQTQRAALASRFAADNPLAADVIQKPDLLFPALMGDSVRAGVARSLMDASRFAADNGMQPLAMDLGTKADAFGATGIMLSEARGVPPDGVRRFDLVDAVRAAKAGEASTPFVALNEAINANTELTRRIRAESERRKAPYARGKGAILQQIITAGNSGRLPKEAIKPITDFVNSVSEKALEDTRISLSVKPKSSTFDFTESLVTLALNGLGSSPNEIDRTAVHEFWHGLSRFIPDEEIEKMRVDYVKFVKKYIAKNPWFVPFIGRTHLNEDQYDDFSRMLSKEEMDSIPWKEWETLDNGKRVRGIKWDKENYRLFRLDEWVVETMADLVRRKQERPTTVLGKMARLIRDFIDTLKQALGDPYLRALDAMTIPDEAFNAVIERDGPIENNPPVMYGGVAEGMNNQFVLGMYAGEKSLENMPEERRAFMQDSLNSARAMAAAGKTSEEIRAVTGWFPGKYDGKMRWEVPDNEAELRLSEYRQKRKDGSSQEDIVREFFQAKQQSAMELALKKAYNLKGKDLIDFSRRFDSEKKKENLGVYSFYLNEENRSRGRIPLSYILKHDQLFDLYPELRFMPVSFNADDMEASPFAIGAFNSSFNGISLNPIYAFENEQDALSTVLHEIQHAIQKTEDFAKGASPDSYLFADVAYKDWLLRAELVQLSDEMNKPLSEAVEMYKPFPQDYESLQSALKAYNSDNDFKDSVSVNIKYWKPRGSVNMFDAYTNTAGEIEARDVQARQALTPEQRAAVAPYSSENIAPEDAIVSYSTARGYTPAPGTYVAVPSSGWMAATGWIASKFRSRGNLTQAGLEVTIMNEQEKKAAANAARFLGNNLGKQIEKVFGRTEKDTKNFRVFTTDASGKPSFTRPYASRAEADAFAAKMGYTDFMVATPEELMNIALGNSMPSLTPKQEEELEAIRERGIAAVQAKTDKLTEQYLRDNAALIEKIRKSGGTAAELDKLKDNREIFQKEMLKYNDSLKALFEEKYKEVNRKFMLENKEKFLSLQANAKMFLPDSILNEIEEARAAIDGRSREIAGIDYLMKDGMMRIVFSAQEGIYVTRAYEAFEAKNREDYVNFLNEAYRSTVEGEMVGGKPLKYREVARERITPLVNVLTGKIIEKRAKDIIAEQNADMVSDLRDEMRIMDEKSMYKKDRKDKEMDMYLYLSDEYILVRAKNEVKRRRAQYRREFIRGIANYLVSNPALLSLPAGAGKKEIRAAAMKMGRDAYNDPDSFDKLITDSAIDRIKLLKYKLMPLGDALIQAQNEYQIAEKLRRAGKPDTSGIKWRTSIGNNQKQSFIEALNSDFQKNLDFILGAPVSGSGGKGVADSWQKLNDEILMHRDNIPAYMRKFWGETESPIQRITQTITKQASLIADSVFRERIASLGLEEGWAVKKEDYDSNPNKYPGYKRIIEGDEGYEDNPLADLYVDGNIYNSLEIRRSGNQPSNDAFKFIGYWVGAALWNATSGLMRGAVRNLASFPAWGMNSGQNLANPITMARVMSNFGIASGAIAEHLATVPRVKGGTEGEFVGLRWSKNLIGTALQAYSFTGPGSKIFGGISGILGSISNVTGRAEKESDRKAFQDLYTRAVNVGVADNNIERNDMARLLGYEDELTRRPITGGKLARFLPSWMRPDDMQGALDYLVQTAKSTAGNRTEYYSSMDSLTKITFWLSEMEEQAKIHAKDKAQFNEWRGENGMFQNLPKELQIKAANNINDTIQSDSRVLEGVNQFRKAGWGKILSPFLASKTEFIRTAQNSYRIALDEMKNGVNKKEKARGARRLVAALTGHIGYSAVASFLAVTVMRMVGGGDDEEKEGVTLDGSQIDSLRKLLPEWAQNKVLAGRAYANGEIDWADVSFQLPFGWMNEIFISGQKAIDKSNAEDILAAEVTMQIVSDFIGNFASRQIAVEAASNALSGFDRIRNKTIWEKDDSVYVKIAKGIKYYLNSAGYPGDVRDAIKMYKAAYGIEENGSKYKMDAVLLSMLTGQSIRTQKIDEMYLSQMRQAQDDLRIVNRSLYQSALRDANNVEPEDVAADTKLAMTRHAETMRELGQMFSSATSLLETGGMAPMDARKKILAIMRSEKVKLSQRDERAIANQYIPPWRGSDVTEREIRRLDRKHNDGRFEAYLDAIRR
jgi:hypothetical protein